MKRLCWVLGGALALVMGSVGLGPAQATPTAYAVPLSGITIDGQLDDWPAELTRYPIDWISPAYKLTPPAGPADFSAHFRVGYEAAAGLLYLAVEVEDDELVTRPEAPGFANQDLCEVYLEVEERGGEGAVVQYLLVPTERPLKAFWQGVPFPLVGNPLGVGDQPPPAGLQGAFQRVGTTTTYEWAIPLVAPGAEEPFPLPVGRRLGFDVALTDVDGQEEAGNWIAWSPGIGKRRHPHHLGSLILLEHPEELGRLAGTVTQADRPGAGLWVEVYQETRRVGVVQTDAQGHYQLPLPPGRYTVQLQRGQGRRAAPLANQTVRAAQSTQADLAARLLDLPPLLQRSAARYAGLRAYADSTQVSLRLFRPGMDHRLSLWTELTWAQPRRFRLATQDDALIGASLMVSDGQMQTLYQERLQQYIYRPAPAPLSRVELPSPLGSGGESLVLHLLLSEDPGLAMIEAVEEIQAAGHELLQGVSTAVFTWTQSTRSLSGGRALPGLDELIPVKVWVGNDDALIRQVSLVLDMESMAASLAALPPAMMQGMQMEITHRHTAIQLDPVVSDTLFQFTPPETARLVAQWQVDGLGPADPAPTAWIGQPAPALALSDLAGQPLTLSAGSGQVVIVYFWATWCAPCRPQLATLAQLHSAYASQGLRVLGLAVEEEEARVASFIQETALPFPVALAEAGVREAYGPLTAIPVAFIVDRQGVVRYLYQGRLPEPRLLAQQVEGLLAE